VGAKVCTRLPDAGLLREPAGAAEREIKRDTSVVGISFNNVSISWLVGAMVLEQSNEWRAAAAAICTLRVCTPSTILCPLGCPLWCTEYRASQLYLGCGPPPIWDTTRIQDQP
jgi:hypothetical protein